MTNAMLKVEDVGNVLNELEGAFFDIPFENSDFQNRVFVVAAQQTPGRAYRALGLQMFSKIQAVKSYLIDQQRKEIDREEKEAKLADPNTSSFDRRRLELDLLEMDQAKPWNEKLLNDALHELSCLYAEYQKFPAYSREMFEREEAVHFDARLKRQLVANGSQESLLNMQQDRPQLEALLQTLALPKQ